MSETPNHGYNTPDEGQENWHEPLNENFAEFDRDIELRGAGEPSVYGHDPTEGAKYLDTDTGMVYTASAGEWREAFLLPRAVIEGSSGPILSDHVQSIELGDLSNTVDDAAGALAAGGTDNEASGEFATVTGGEGNVASGAYAVAAGREAEALEDGSFVVGDSSDDPVQSLVPDQARFQGSVRGSNLVTENGVLYREDETDITNWWATHYVDEEDEWRVSRWVIPPMGGGYWHGVLSVGTGTTTLDSDLSVGGDGSVQRTAGPISKGYVSDDGTLGDAVNVDSATWETDFERYRIELSDVSYSFNEYATTVTPTSDPISLRTNSQGGDLLVEFEGDQQTSFTFVVHALNPPE